VKGRVGAPGEIGVGLVGGLARARVRREKREKMKGRIIVEGAS